MLAVTGDELVILSLIFKKSPACDDVVIYLCGLHFLGNFRRTEHLRLGFSGIKRTSVCHKTLCIFGEYCIFIGKLKRVHESLAKSLDECERAAQEKHLALYLSALSKTRNGLVNNGLENGSGDILTSCALI